MKVLILEDDSFKSDRLAALVAANVSAASIDTVFDVASAVKAISQSRFDLVVLDMALPSHRAVLGGGAPMSLLTGGLEILFELSALRRTDKCVIVTQYPEIELAGRFYSVSDSASAIKEHFSCDVIGCLQYSEETTEWTKTFIGLLKLYENLNS